MNLPFARVAVIGAGSQGWQLALQAARAGYNAVLEDILPSKLRSAAAQLRNGVSALAVTNLDELMGRIEFATTIEDAVRDADLVIDFVPDELESKLEIFSMLDRMAPPRTVICSPLREVSLADVASCTYRATQCAGVRFEKDRVEIERASFTDEQVVSRLTEFWRSLGKQVRVIADSREPAPH